ILFTSGSTGTPKCVPLSFDNITNNVNAFCRRLDIREKDRFICTSPPWYAHGLYNSLLTSFIIGSSTLSPGILNVLNCRNILLQSSMHNANIYHLTPSMIKILAMVGRKVDFPLPKFKKVICGTARLEKNDKKDFEKIFGVPVIQQYGMTETLFMCVNDRGMETYPESVGVPVGCKIKVIGPEGRSLKHNSTGQILCKTKSMFGSYYMQEKETADSYRKGWFQTGDIGFFNKKNYLFITGRLKEIIKKGGFNINPNEIDSVLLKISSVKQAKTLGIPDKTYGEEIISFVVASGENFTETSLRRACAKKLPGTHIPKRIFLIKNMPLTSTGKISNTKLIDMAKNYIKIKGV
ncbi:MAG TPA: fatty acid--CoA ligase family protein, partial [Victivallales bacterium]|nr:fatty acid--CoA ligase family protein [Victivallales bacterium]